MKPNGSFFLFAPPFLCHLCSLYRHSRCAECEPEGGWGQPPPLFFSTQAEEAKNASFALMSDVFMRGLRCHPPWGSCEVALLRCHLLNDEVARALSGLLQPHLHATMCSSHLAGIATARHRPIPAGVTSSAPRSRGESVCNYAMALQVFYLFFFIFIFFFGWFSTKFVKTVC